MKKRYFIFAYDAIYGGMDGKNDSLFFCGTFKEALDIAADMSYDIILSHSSIMEELREQDYESLEDAIQEDMAYEIYDLRDDAPSFEELRKMDYSPDEYIERFCAR